MDASELLSSIPQWQGQREILVHKERFYFNLFSSLETVTGGDVITSFVDGEIAKYLLYTQRPWKHRFHPHQVPGGARTAAPQERIEESPRCVEREERFRQ